MPKKTFPRTVLSLVIAVALPAAAWAQAPSPPPPVPAPAPGAPVTVVQVPVPGAPAAAPAAPGAPKPFKEVVKDAREIPGFFTLYEKDEKVWIAVKPEQFEQPFYFSAVATNGLGEKQVYGGLMGPRHIVTLRKIGPQVQLVAQNMRFRAKPGSPAERAVKTSFSDSLLASAPVASQPHPDTKAVLVEANALLLADIAGSATTLEAAFRMPFALDAKNSSIVKARSAELVTGFNVLLHFSVPKLAPPPLVPNPAMPQVPPPRTTPDARSLFLGYHYSFAPLPAPMPSRTADERVGYFTSAYQDYTADLSPNPGVFLVNRWRLEKKDPAAALSEPRQPIVYWLDKNIPDRYRQAVIDGILEWNKAFERIGFKDAVQAKIQPDDADFDTSDIRHASVRWYLAAEGGPAIGPSHADPRTGEILDADILMTDNFPRGGRRIIVEEVPRSMAGIFAGEGRFCTFAGEAMAETEFAMDLLEARGELEPGSPEADAFVNAYVKEVITHEVGHTLGLRHNFRSSTIYTSAQLRDPEFTRKNGIVGSVMDYPPYNLPLKGEPRADILMASLGPYDYWAIEYGYKPLDAATEKEELERIASRGSAEPWLAYGTDEDSFIGGGPQGMDPTVNTWDLSSEPLAYFRRRLELSRELWDRLQAKKLAPGESYDVLRRNLLSGFNSVARGMAPATKYIGGVVQVRDRAGSGRLPFTPIPAAQQREALKLISEGVLSVDSFRFTPELLNSVPYNRLEYFELLIRGQDPPPTTLFSLSTQVATLQRTVLDQLMSDAVAARLVDFEGHAVDPKQAFRLSELYDTLNAAVWSELKSGRDITPLRRNLQREHLRRMSGALLRPAPATPADARALQRENARALLAQIKAAQAKPAFSKEARAHLAESANTLDEALRAPMQRAGT
jgi:hypothetical protein